MILAVSIENSSIVFGGWEQGKFVFFSRICTDRTATPDEYAVRIQAILSLYQIDPGQIEGAILSSVVPPLLSVIRQAIGVICPVRILVVGPGIKTGLNIKLDHLGQVGSDRVCAAVAACAGYPHPVLVFDLGSTATTLSVISDQGVFIGGSILPGAELSLRVLAEETSQLPQISLEEGPKSLIGTNTIDAMRAGILYGTACMLDGMIARHKEILGNSLSVVATGVMANPILPYCRETITLDPDLLLTGLILLYQKNVREKRNVSFHLEDFDKPLSN